MTIEISLSDLEVKVRELAAEMPNFQYVKVGGQCQYVHRRPDGNFTGGCIIGRALVGMGVPETAFFDDEGEGFVAPVEAILARLAINGDISIAGIEKPHDERIPNAGLPMPTSELVNHHSTQWLLDVQRNQDDDVLWGESVLRADANAYYAIY